MPTRDAGSISSSSSENRLLIIIMTQKQSTWNDGAVNARNTAVNGICRESCRT